jgi:tungstate transport system substrate-binding protein
VVAAGGATLRARDRVILATTTSTADAGLLDQLLPVFEARAKVKVKIIAVGSGEALAMGRRGDADVLLVHSPAAEDAFMAEGWGALRLDVMHNDFLLAGPASDPAKVKGQPIIEAFRRIRATGASFVSRGDESGTHNKEQELWKAAGLAPPLGKALISTGQGMSESAHVASEKQAYILIDRGSFLALRRSLDMVALSEGGKELFNPYRVIVVNPTKTPKVKAREGEALARWLVSPEAQALIGEFGRTQHGQSLYIPDAPAPPRRGQAPEPNSTPERRLCPNPPC